MGADLLEQHRLLLSELELNEFLELNELVGLVRWVQSDQFEKFV